MGGQEWAKPAASAMKRRPLAAAAILLQWLSRVLHKREILVVYRPAIQSRQKNSLISAVLPGAGCGRPACWFIHQSLSRHCRCGMPPAARHAPIFMTTAQTIATEGKQKACGF
jgi:hypothetical protein